MAHIRVSCRLRPQSAQELEAGGTECITCSGTSVAIGRVKSTTEFNLDHVFDTGATQQTVYETVARPLVEDVLGGYNCTVFAYGQTGSGKTHTLLGDPLDEKACGLAPRAVDELFHRIRQLEQTDHPGAAPEAVHQQVEFAVKVSYLEIYNEQVRDLLNPTPRRTGLRVRESADRGVHVEHATEWIVADADEAKSLLQQGSASRSVGAHAMNARSSRSHTLFVQTVERRVVGACDSPAAPAPSATKDVGNMAMTMGASERRTGRMYIVDLAGSEMVRKTQASGQALQEARHINKSLSALALVISALSGEDTAGLATEGGSVSRSTLTTSDEGGNRGGRRASKSGATSLAKHVPYRDSKLTRILQDSLGGNAKTHLIVTCSISSLQQAESLSTLRFGSCASRVRNRPRINQVKNVNYYQERLAAAELSLKRLSAHISRLEHEPPTSAVNVAASGCAEQCPVCGHKLQGRHRTPAVSPRDRSASYDGRAIAATAESCQGENKGNCKAGTSNVKAVAGTYVSSDENNVGDDDDDAGGDDDNDVEDDVERSDDAVRSVGDAQLRAELTSMLSELRALKREKQAIEARWRIERDMLEAIDARKRERNRANQREVAALRVRVRELEAENAAAVAMRDEVLQGQTQARRADAIKSGQIHTTDRCASPLVSMQQQQPKQAAPQNECANTANPVNAGKLALLQERLSDAEKEAKAGRELLRERTQELQEVRARLRTIQCAERERWARERAEKRPSAKIDGTNTTTAALEQNHSTKRGLVDLSNVLDSAVDSGQHGAPGSEDLRCMRPSTREGIARRHLQQWWGGSRAGAHSTGPLEASRKALSASIPTNFKPLSSLPLSVPSPTHRKSVPIEALAAQHSPTLPDRPLKTRGVGADEVLNLLNTKIDPQASQQVCHRPPARHEVPLAGGDLTEDNSPADSVQSRVRASGHRVTSRLHDLIASLEEQTLSFQQIRERTAGENKRRRERRERGGATEVKC